jgi:putative membrane protein
MWPQVYLARSALSRLDLGRERQSMKVVADILVGLVAVIHVYILILEMFLWRTARGRATFGTTPEFALQSAPLAANQGLYNGFLAAGLAYGIIADATAFRVFFLVCVLLAGIYGAITVSRRILLVQALPAAVALIFVLLAYS